MPFLGTSLFDFVFVFVFIFVFLDFRCCLLFNWYGIFLFICLSLFLFLWLCLFLLKSFFVLCFPISVVQQLLLHIPRVVDILAYVYFLLDPGLEDLVGLFPEYVIEKVGEVPLLFDLFVLLLPHIKPIGGEILPVVPAVPEFLQHLLDLSFRHGDVL